MEVLKVLFCLRGGQPPLEWFSDLVRLVLTRRVRSVSPNQDCFSCEPVVMGEQENSI